MAASTARYVTPPLVNATAGCAASAADTPSDRLYTGQRLEEEAGLYYYVARWYDPVLAHFIQADMMVPNARSLLSYLRYSYVYFNPLILVDPDGHAAGCSANMDAGNCGSKGKEYYDRVERENERLYNNYIYKLKREEYQRCGNGKCKGYAPIWRTVLNGIIGLVGVSAISTVVSDIGVTTIVGGVTESGPLISASGDYENKVATVERGLGQLTNIGKSIWRSTAGLEYGPDKAFGNRVLHVLNHTVDDLSRSFHGVFTVGNDQVLPLIDQAWEAVQSGGSNVISTVQQGAKSVYIVDMGKAIGYLGGKIGAANGNPFTNLIKLVIENGKNVITAYPIN